VATGTAHETNAPHTPGLLLTEILAGHEVKTGAWLSFTVTVNEHVLVFPPASVAVNETFVTPIGNVDPLGSPAVCVTMVPAQLSLTTGASQVTMAPHVPAVLGVVILAGQDVNTGG
jgi:hypothetical protein